MPGVLLQKRPTGNWLKFVGVPHVPAKPQLAGCGVTMLTIVRVTGKGRFGCQYKPVSSDGSVAMSLCIPLRQRQVVAACYNVKSEWHWKHIQGGWCGGGGCRG